MSDNMTSDSDVDSDEVWDDLDEDYDILDDDLDEDLDQETTSRKHSSKKSQKASKSKPTKSFKSKLIPSVLALSVMAGGAWFAVSSNPSMLNLIMGMTTGQKYFEPTPINLNNGQTEQVVNVKNHAAGDAIDNTSSSSPVAAQEPIDNQIQTPINQIDTPPLPQIPNLETQSDEQTTSTSESISAPEDSGFLTPMPLETPKQESPIHQGIDLANLEESSDPPVVNQDLKVPEQDMIVEEPKTKGIPLEVNQNTENNQSLDVKLEEDVLLDQTEKIYADIQTDNLLSPPVPEADVGIKSAQDAESSASISQKQKIEIKTAESAHTDKKDLQSQIASTIKDTHIKIPDSDKNITSEQKAQTETELKKAVPDDKIKYDNTDKNSTTTDEPISYNSQVTQDTLKDSDQSKIKKSTPIDPTKQKQSKELSSKNKAPVRKWSLRSANLNSAVLLDKTSGNIVSIGVGSQVEGIGKVKAITKENGKWIVKGTNGTIKQ